MSSFFIVWTTDETSGVLFVWSKHSWRHPGQRKFPDLSNHSLIHDSWYSCLQLSCTVNFCVVVKQIGQSWSSVSCNAVSFLEMTSSESTGLRPSLSFIVAAGLQLEARHKHIVMVIIKRQMVNTDEIKTTSETLNVPPFTLKIKHKSKKIKVQRKWNSWISPTVSKTASIHILVNIFTST